MIKKFQQFINEEVSGTEIPQKNKGSYFGPAYGDTVSPNTINKFHTHLIHSDGAENPNSKNDLTSDLFSIDDYKELHINYLKSGGKESDLSGDKQTDIPIMMDYLNNN